MMLKLPCCPPPHDCNPTTRLGTRLGIRGFKICTIMVLGNMDDEHTFSNLFLHEIKVLKLFDYALGSHCVDVYIKILHLGNLPILHNNVQLD
jgi:hypothetical protein